MRWGAGAAKLAGMKAASSFAVVLVTAPDLKTARALAGVILDRRLAACVNLVPGVESHYQWQGKRERSREVLLVIKTRKARLAALERAVLAAHPYDTPEFLVMATTGGNASYLAWVAGNC